MKNINADFAELTRILTGMGVKKSDIDKDKPLKDMGINSIDTMDLILKIEENFKIVMPDKYLTSKVLHSPKTLLAAIKRITGVGKLRH